MWKKSPAKSPYSIKYILFDCCYCYYFCCCCSWSVCTESTMVVYMPVVQRTEKKKHISPFSFFSNVRKLCALFDMCNILYYIDKYIYISYWNLYRVSSWFYRQPFFFWWSMVYICSRRKISEHSTAHKTPNWLL